ncbi:MAG: aminotransferase class V-fold PLP-dependent enzyme [Planctomycetaceae bacterium]|nr:aminotransferase class V-fold PLP-dependent enzyme [Planctomycetaceae bacterium]
MLANVAAEFPYFAGRIWLNSAHQGPLPKSAVLAAQGAVRQKAFPSSITEEEFDDVPSRLRAAIGHISKLPSDEIILGNGGSYGLNLLAAGLPWKHGDEIVIAEDEFPATIIPWLRLRDLGVQIRLISTDGSGGLVAETLRKAITKRTRLVCASWVNSYTGWRLDLPSISRECGTHDVLFVLNLSQGLGARDLNLDGLEVAAVTCCGYKWLCGPYGTGFAWVEPKLLKRMQCCQTNWWAHREWAKKHSFEGVPPSIGARAFDIGCTANFLNFVPWTVSLQLLHGRNLRNIEVHNEKLTEHFIEGLDKTRYAVDSTQDPMHRSSVLIISHSDPSMNRRVVDHLRDNKIDVAFRNKKVRLSPHFFNTRQEIDATLDALHCCK